MVCSRVNCCYQWLSFTVILYMAQLLAVAVIYNLIKLFEKIPYLAYAGIILFGFDLFTFIEIIYGMAGEVHFKSGKILGIWEKMEKIQNATDLEKHGFHACFENKVWW